MGKFLSCVYVFYSEGMEITSVVFYFCFKLSFCLYSLSHVVINFLLTYKQLHDKMYPSKRIPNINFF